MVDILNRIKENELLIVPVGIEINGHEYIYVRGVKLLIVPVGIEILMRNPPTFFLIPFNRTSRN